MKLTGTWKYKLDPEDGETPESVEKASGWKETDLPKNWYLDGLDYTGTVWYFRRFEYQPEEELETLLRFHGVDYFASVWLNGAKVGDHEGYFQSFEFNVTDFVTEGENDLLVRVNSPEEVPGEVWPAKKKLVKGIFNHHDARPGSWDPDRGQEKNTGGIWNEVEIEEKPEQYISGIRVAPRLIEGGEAVIRIKVKVKNQGHRSKADLDIELSPDNFTGEKVRDNFSAELETGENLLEETLRISDPGLWWTWDHGDQNLYECLVGLRTEGAEDECRERFGVRELALTGEDANSTWTLNGRRFFPRGSNIIPTQWLSEYGEDMIEEDVELMLEANLNTIRVHAHVNREEFYRACDEAGILVWQDFALQWSYEESDEFYKNAVAQLRDMIEQLYNHPSIGVWCCHNEPSVNENTLDDVLYDVAREEDPLRVVEHHSDFRDHPYPGWYLDDYGKFEALPGAPFVNEFGAQALPDADHVREMFADPDDAWPPDWEAYSFHDFQYDQTFNVARIDTGDSLEAFVENSQQYQYDLLKFAIEKYRKNRYDPMVGVLQFMFVDCWPSITWSVVDYRREPKKGYEALKLGMQPVLPTFEIMRKRLQPGEMSFAIFGNLKVVNDLHEEFQNSRITIYLEDESGREHIAENKTVDIPADGVVTVMETKAGLLEDKWVLPREIEPGTYHLRVKIEHDGEIIGKNVESFEIVAKEGNQFKIDMG